MWVKCTWEDTLPLLFKPCFLFSMKSCGELKAGLKWLEAFYVSFLFPAVYCRELKPGSFKAVFCSPQKTTGSRKQHCFKCLGATQTPPSAATKIQGELKAGFKWLPVIQTKLLRQNPAVYHEEPDFCFRLFMNHHEPPGIVPKFMVVCPGLSWFFRS